MNDQVNLDRTLSLVLGGYRLRQEYDKPYTDEFMNLIDKVEKWARLGYQLDPDSNPNCHILPINYDVPLDEALSTIRHLVYLGSKPWFNGQRIADCYATVEKYAKLGES